MRTLIRTRRATLLLYKQIESKYAIVFYTFLCRNLEPLPRSTMSVLDRDVEKQDWAPGNNTVNNAVSSDSSENGLSKNSARPIHGWKVWHYSPEEVVCLSRSDPSCSGLLRIHQ